MKETFVERDPHDSAESRERYVFANKIIGERKKTGNVLDLCCGSGYGTTILSNAKRITAVDHSSDALELMKKHARKDATLVLANAESLPREVREKKFDAVMCLEGLEHVENPQKLLNEIRQVLKPQGIAIISTPNKQVTSPGLEKPPNPYHLKEYEEHELRELLEKNFKNTQLYGHKIIKDSLRARVLSKVHSSVFVKTIYRMLMPHLPNKVVQIGKNEAYEKGILPLKSNLKPVNFLAVCSGKK